MRAFYAAIAVLRVLRPGEIMSRRSILVKYALLGCLVSDMCGTFITKKSADNDSPFSREVSGGIIFLIVLLWSELRHHAETHYK